METLTILGGQPLRGTLAVQGSKTAVLPILAAAAAIPGRFALTNFPPIRDGIVTRELLERLGVRTFLRGDCLRLDSTGPVGSAPDPKLACWPETGRPRSPCRGAACWARGRWICI